MNAVVQLRQRIEALKNPSRRAEYLEVLNALAEIPDDLQRQAALAALSRRTLRAEGLDQRPVMRRA